MGEMNKYLGIAIVVLAIGFIFLFKMLKKLIKVAIIIAIVIVGLSVVTKNEVSFDKIKDSIPHLAEEFNENKIAQSNEKFDIVKEISNITELMNLEESE